MSFRSALLVGLLLVPTTTSALERLCDPQHEDCRAPLLQLIRQEQQAIDVGFWYMSDARYSAALIKRFQAGIPVRILMDARVVQSKRDAAFVLQQLARAGIPMRTKVGGRIFHWKTMIFHGQGVVELSKANFTAESFVPKSSTDYFDEAIYFTSRPGTVESLRSQFDTYWTSSRFTAYANSGTPQRTAPAAPIAWDLNFHPEEDFNWRLARRIVREPVAVDVIVFRLTSPWMTEFLLYVHSLGVQVRVLIEPQEYYRPLDRTHRANIDALAAAGVQIRARVHKGLTHEGLVVLHGLQEVVFGSANLYTPSDVNEHNLFVFPGRLPLLDSGEILFGWFARQFARKWADPTAFRPFRP